jgi:hypothetical protein
VLPIEAVDVVDEAKVPNPLVHPNQIEIRRANEEGRDLAPVKVPTNV